MRNLETGTTLNLGPIDPVLRFAPLLLPVLLWRSTGRSPPRPQVADVSRLLTAPGGPRAVIVWKMLILPLVYALVAFLGTLLARCWLGPPLGPTWNVALAGAVVGSRFGWSPSAGT